MTYRKIKNKEINSAARLGAEAFADYPLCANLKDNFDSEPHFVKFLTEVFKVYIMAYKNQECPVFVCVENGRLLSLSILVKPGMNDVTLMDYIKAGAIKLFFKCDPIQLLKLLSILNEGHGPCDDMKKEAWFLESLSVEKNNKGKHLGSGMLQDCVIPYIKKQTLGKVAYFVTFTNNVINRKFYVKNGFEEFDSSEMVQGGRRIGNWSFKMRIEC